MVAHITAIDEPIAVPMSCRKYKSPNSKILSFIIHFIATFIALRSRPLGSWLSIVSSSSHYEITWIAWLVSVWVYIELHQQQTAKHLVVAGVLLFHLGSVDNLWHETSHWEWTLKVRDQVICSSSSKMYPYSKQWDGTVELWGSPYATWL